MALCKGCGAKITWARTKEGKMIPLDMSAPVYEIFQPDPFGNPDRVDAVRIDSHRAGVLHFKTCPKADEFSASR